MTGLPSSWIEVKLSDVLLTLETGFRPKGGVRHITNGLPSLGGEHINSEGSFKLDNIKFIPEQFANTLNRGKIEKGDILIVKDGATTGKVAFVDSGFPFHIAYINEHVFRCEVSANSSYPKYIFWFLFSPLGNSEILNNFRGAAQGGIIKSFAENVAIPLPPLKEQQYIANKLDTMFAKASSAKGKLNRMQDILKQLRQSAINKAASGLLTRNWRLNNSLPEWQSMLLLDVLIDKPRNGYSPKPVDYETPVKSLTLTATTRGVFDPSFYKFIDEEIPKTSHLWLEDGDILIQRGNTIEYVGVSAIYNGKSNIFIYPDLMMKLKANERILPEFLYYCLSSDPTRQYFRDNASGVSGSMPKINQAVVSNTSISLPSIQEQKEIVHRVSFLISLIKRIEEKSNQVLAQTETLINSSLINAFNGVLSKTWRLKNANETSVIIDTPIQKTKKSPKRNNSNKQTNTEVNMKVSQIIPILEVLQKIHQPISAQNLLQESGYPNDASTDEIERFFIDIRTNLEAGKIKRERNKNEDYFEIINIGAK